MASETLRREQTLSILDKLRSAGMPDSVRKRKAAMALDANMSTEPLPGEEASLGEGEDGTAPIDTEEEQLEGTPDYLSELGTPRKKRLGKKQKDALGMDIPADINGRY